eukprot:GHRR01022087.1.p1 GENE.GHRR01022087.1~~GHRR01022087.1.p1  ORF type:complete len:110 (-),score=28.42 GHRR01022087.1:930-1259(-)
MLMLQVQAIRVEKTVLAADPVNGSIAVGTGEFEEYPVQMVLKSIGYKSLPLEGVPFDHRQGVVPNYGGRVLKGVLPRCSPYTITTYCCPRVCTAAMWWCAYGLDCCMQP